VQWGAAMSEPQELLGQSPSNTPREALDAEGLRKETARAQRLIEEAREHQQHIRERLSELDRLGD